jgi:Cys-tRNA(Pro)/Cys-tRNA(Cys) deacylase
MATRAIQFLNKRKISFEVVKYTHDAKGAKFAAQATGFPVEQIIKTLIVERSDRRYCMALMPGNHQLDLKRLAIFFGIKKATLADRNTIERLTGYLVGGISPFGTKQMLPAVLDEKALGFETVMINGGQRGLMVKLSPEDIQVTLNCLIAAIARD